MIYSIDYSSGYSEGDNASSPVVDFDLTLIHNKLDILYNAVNALFLKIDNLLSGVVNCDLTGINDKYDFLLSKIDNLVTQNYIDSKIPFVDDMSLKAFKVGQIVTVLGLKNIDCTVISSHMLPIDENNYVVVYTVRYIDGLNVYTSDFPASHCTLKV